MISQTTNKTEAVQEDSTAIMSGKSSKCLIKHSKDLPLEKKGDKKWKQV